MVVLVPRIVPHKYVSTTLGAHKAVSAASPLLRRITHRSIQLEQTGSTIFQTVAGLVLDVKSGKHDKLAPGQGDPKDVQYLLNAFVILNILEVLAVIALSRLDRKQKEEASRRMSALLPQTIDESDEEGDVGPMPSGGGTGADIAHEQPVGPVDEGQKITIHEDD